MEDKLMGVLVTIAKARMRRCLAPATRAPPPHDRARPLSSHESGRQQRSLSGLYSGRRPNMSHHRLLPPCGAGPGRWREAAAAKRNAPAASAHQLAPTPTRWRLGWRPRLGKAAPAPAAAPLCCPPHSRYVLDASGALAPGVLLVMSSNVFMRLGGHLHRRGRSGSRLATTRSSERERSLRDERRRLGSGQALAVYWRWRGTAMVHRHYRGGTDTSMELCWYCHGAALVLPKGDCPGATLVPYWHCAFAVLVLYWYYPALYWHCAGTTLVLHGHCTGTAVVPALAPI